MIVLIGVFGLVIAVVVVRGAIDEHVQMGRELRADIAEMEAARAPRDGFVVTSMPAPPPALVAGEIVTDSHDPGWEPITPDLIA